MRNVKTSNKKLIILLIIAALSALLLLFLSNKITVSSNKIKLDTTAGMTAGQRINDFKDMCDFMKKKIPYILEYENLYGIKFDEIKNYYFSQIKNAKSDYEYYTLIQGFINNIPSGHMTLGYPDIEMIPALYTFRTSDYENFGQTCNYWENILKEECEKYYGSDYTITPYYYVDGKYYSDSGERLVSVNDVSVDEFIKICSLNYKLCYDHKNNKPFREIIIFNDICGTECTVQYEKENGEIISEKAYYGTSGGVVLNYIDYFYNCDNPTNEKEEQNKPYNTVIDYSQIEISGNNMYLYNDLKKDSLYLKINDFSYGGSEALNALDNVDIPQNIIIDLRDNTGGFEGVCDALIEKITNHNIEFEARVYSTYKSDESKTVKHFEIPFKTDLKRLYINNVDESLAGQSSTEYNIYVLVSNVTLSAADRFAFIIKDSGTGTVIGAFNTSGEAYGSPDLSVLSTSGLYFYYTDRTFINSDGTDNSVYGTAPDIYVSFDKNSLKERNNLVLNNKPPYTYENRLKWDNVLIETLKIIKEKENDKRNNPSNE